MTFIQALLLTFFNFFLHKNTWDICVLQSCYRHTLLVQLYISQPVLSCMSCAVLLYQEREAQNEAELQSSEPSERELALQEALNTSQQEKDSVTAQFQAQVRNKVTHAWSLLIYSLTRISFYFVIHTIKI